MSNLHSSTCPYCQMVQWASINKRNDRTKFYQGQAYRPISSANSKARQRPISQTNVWLRPVPSFLEVFCKRNLFISNSIMGSGSIKRLWLRQKWTHWTYQGVECHLHETHSTLDSDTKVFILKKWWEVGVTVQKSFTKSEQKSAVYFFGETLNLTKRLMIKSWTAHSAQNGPIFAHFWF